MRLLQRQNAVILALACVAGGCATRPSDGLDGSGEAAAVTSGTAPRTSEERLQASFDDAKKLYDAGEYGDAADGFGRVYAYSPRSRLAEEGLFFTAEAAFQDGQHQRAFDVYERFLKEFPASPHYPEATSRIFQIGKLYVEGRAKKRSLFLGIHKTDPAFGIEILLKFVEKREGHPLAPEALFLVGQAQLQDDEPEKAIESWQRLSKEYPGTSWARLGEFNTALAFLALSYGVEYDKRPIVTALRRLKTYVRRYPNGDNVQAAQAKADSLEEELASHELGTAKRYARDDRFVAAQIYLSAIRREYPKTKAAVEAERLAKTWDNPPLPPLSDDEDVRAKPDKPADKAPEKK